MQVLKRQLNVLWEIAQRRPTAHLAFLYDVKYRNVYDNKGCMFIIFKNTQQSYDIITQDIENTLYLMNRNFSIYHTFYMPSQLNFWSDKNNNKRIEWSISWGLYPYINYYYNTKGDLIQRNEWERRYNVRVVKYKVYRKGHIAERKRQQVETQFRLFIERKGQFKNYDEMQQFFWENNK